MEHAILTLAGLDEVYIVGASLLLVSKLAFFPSLAGSSAHLNFSTITPEMPPLAEGHLDGCPFHSAESQHLTIFQQLRLTFRHPTDFSPACLSQDCLQSLLPSAGVLSRPVCKSSLRAPAPGPTMAWYNGAQMGRASRPIRPRRTNRPQRTVVHQRSRLARHLRGTYHGWSHIKCEIQPVCSRCQHRC